MCAKNVQKRNKCVLVVQGGCKEYIQRITHTCPAERETDLCMRRMHLKKNVYLYIHGACRSVCEENKKSIHKEDFLFLHVFGREGNDLCAKNVHRRINRKKMYLCVSGRLQICVRGVIDFSFGLAS